jgi:hypothetical protein
VRIWPGQDRHDQAAVGRPVQERAVVVDQRRLTPNIGRVAEPGFSAVAPGRGVIIAPPVSVCHQVSTIGQRPSPTTL